MTSDLLFVYGTLMRGFDHPMAQAAVGATPTSSARRAAGGRLYLVKHYPGLVLSDAPDEVVFGELYRLRAAEALLREFDMYEACGEGFAEPTEYVRQMLPVTSDDGAVSRRLDLPLQLAGRAAAAHRLGTVSGEVIPCPGRGALRPGHDGRQARFFVNIQSSRFAGFANEAIRSCE